MTAKPSISQSLPEQRPCSLPSATTLLPAPGSSAFAGGQRSSRVCCFNCWIDGGLPRSGLPLHQTQPTRERASGTTTSTRRGDPETPEHYVNPARGARWRRLNPRPAAKTTRSAATSLGQGEDLDYQCCQSEEGKRIGTGCVHGDLCQLGPDQGTGEHWVTCYHHCPRLCHESAGYSANPAADSRSMEGRDI